MKYKNTSLSLSLACLLGVLSHQAHATVTLDFAGVGAAIGGTADASNLAVGDSVLFTGLGDSSVMFDAVLTLNSISANPITGTSATFNTALPDSFVTVSQGSPVDSFGVFTLSFIEAGSSTMANPFGNSAALTGVTSFLAQDIDSQTVATDLSDVFGFALTGEETNIVRGSALVNGGFINNTDPAGFDFSRLNTNSGPGDANPNTFNGEDNQGRDNVPTQTDYQFDGTTSLSSLQFVFGATSTNPNLTTSNRGLLAELDFTGVEPVPEPSSALLSLVAVIGSICRRKRR